MFLAPLILILGTGWLLYFVLFGWVLALTYSCVVVLVAAVSRKLCNELPAASS